MKIKVNTEKETISIKGLTPVEFSVIEALLSHVRMGQTEDGGASEVPFTFFNEVERNADELEALDIPEVGLSATVSESDTGSVDATIPDPTLEVVVYE